MTKTLVSAYSLSDRIMMWGFSLYILFWGIILTDSSLEQMGLIPNLIINRFAFDTMHLQSMYPMLTMGILCLISSVGVAWLATLKVESK